jgi:hypothetical protein
MLLDYTTNRPMQYYRANEFFVPHFNSIKNRAQKRKQIHPIFGIEIEFNDPRRSHFLQEDVSPFTRKIAIIKYDGSLAYGGIEICSRPMHLKAHRVAWKPLFDKIKAKSVNPSVSAGTGLHIHFARDYAQSHLVNSGESNERELYYLIADFMRANKPFFELCGGRRSSQWCRYGRGYTSEHNGALNLRQNTIEFRIFKSPKNYDTCLKGIEFIDALMKWAIRERNANNPVSTAPLIGFIQFINGNRRDYPKLNAFLYKKRKVVYGMLNIPTFQD